MTYWKKITALATLLTLSSCAPEPALAGAGCHVIGDSLATIQGLGGQFPQCAMNAKIGIPASMIVSRADIHGAKFVIVSAGNNPEPGSLNARLEAIRSRITADEIVWIVPHEGRAGAVVRAFAARHGDKAVGFAGELHPFSYAVLARDVRSNL